MKKTITLAILYFLPFCYVFAQPDTLEQEVYHRELPKNASKKPSDSIRVTSFADYLNLGSGGRIISGGMRLLMSFEIIERLKLIGSLSEVIAGTDNVKSNLVSCAFSEAGQSVGFEFEGFKVIEKGSKITMNAGFCSIKYKRTPLTDTLGNNKYFNALHAEAGCNVKLGNKTQLLNMGNLIVKGSFELDTRLYAAYLPKIEEVSKFTMGLNVRVKFKIAGLSLNVFYAKSLWGAFAKEDVVGFGGSTFIQ